MTDASKLTLSAEELQLVTNTSWILTKRNILDKAAEILGQHAASVKPLLQQSALPVAVKNTTAKIARGENYLQLPWLMLDYPRVFNRQHIFAIRTMFWWGNFFSVTLHLSGMYQQQYQNTIKKNAALLQQQFYMCHNATDEWQHHFEPDNYLPAEIFFAKNYGMADTMPFIKIACKHSLKNWNEVPPLLLQSFKTLLTVLEA